MKYIFVMAMLLSFQKLSAQIETPVKWSYAAKKKSAKEAVVFIKATIDEGWHIYSQNIKDGGPVKTSFTFTKSKLYTLTGRTTEPTPVTHFEKSFSMDVSYFEKSVIFQQKIKLRSGKATVKGSLEYMTCNDHKCLPPSDVDFSIDVK
ncbi:protein-disulfide reductase DsbD domain-containing protein [Mucilaginibacter sp. FT3.2]|uniref:protein-disulfide reductase DsbD domain-containing protein n=1 Tax=Mucilaginibacter sp. FT3.2 TaxID=2723090 RepID=UPI001614E40C|nr:protein-disulfide reductase DsbD domain-containing protein [Mucilaginibacter sp. FT3.2]MBB6235100.1 thiol:disulfide interchange protein DsbD [Mucilaginibacter sp. FT3.2]